MPAVPWTQGKPETCIRALPDCVLTTEYSQNFYLFSEMFPIEQNTPDPSALLLTYHVLRRAQRADAGFGC